MQVNYNKYYDKCIKAGMCDKGIELWDKEEDLIDFAKEECEFVIHNKPLTHKEILSLFSLETLNNHNVYIEQELDKLIETPDKNPTSVYLGCSGIIRLVENSNILNIADNSKLQVRIFSDGMTTIRLYTNSEVDLYVKNKNNVVLIFNYGGKCNIKESYNAKNITEKKINRGI